MNGLWFTIGFGTAGFLAWVGIMLHGFHSKESPHGRPVPEVPEFY